MRTGRACRQRGQKSSDASKVSYWGRASATVSSSHTWEQRHGRFEETIIPHDAFSGRRSASGPQYCGPQDRSLGSTRTALPQQAAGGGLPPYFDAGAGVEVLGAAGEVLGVLGTGADAAGAGADAGLAGAGVEVLGVGFAAVCMPTG